MLLSSNLVPCRVTDIFLTCNGGEMLVIHKRGRVDAFRVNLSAAYIWQLCNGVRNIAEITAIVKETEETSDEAVEVEVSDTLCRLFSQGLLDFGTHMLKPFASISFSNYAGDLNDRHHFFINLLGQWFDLRAVEGIDGSDIYINFSDPELHVHTASLQIYVAKKGNAAVPAQGYDFVFTPERDDRISQERNLLLPKAAASGSLPILLSEDQEKLVNILGEIGGEGNLTPSSTIPDAKAEVTPTKKLTIGMATYDDYDGVYFSVQAIRMYHPEVTEETEILVIDNNPSGPCAEALRNLGTNVSGYRYIAVDEIRGTAVRDFVFTKANTEYVMCIDSHVFIEPGAIRKLIDYFDEHPDTPDLLQGPLIYDDLKSISTHFEPAWRQGMFGFWSTDERGMDVLGEPFDIPMQGLGLAACRKQAWQGYNPRFSGFGGEEGYIHQKFRNAGARTLCLPFLRWMHRFSRPMGVHYPNKWEERIRNYLIGFEEVGLDVELLRQHFYGVTSQKVVEEIVQQIKDEENDPFNFFDGIYCINLDREVGRWQKMEVRLKMLGIRDRVIRFSAIETPESHHIGCALSHRNIIENARKKGFQNVLVLEDDAMFHDETLKHLSNSLVELKHLDWNAFYLGGMKWGEVNAEPYAKINGCRYLETPRRMTTTHAIAYNAGLMDIILEDLPDNIEAMKSWLKKHRAIDQYLTKLDKLVVMSPVVATQANILGKEDSEMREGFH